MPDSKRPRLCRVAGRDAWHIYYRGRRVSTFTSDRTEAERALAAYLDGLSRPDIKAISISSILEAYLADRRDKGVPGADRLSWAHKPLRRFWGHRPPELVDPASCRAYVRHRGQESSGPHGKAGSLATARTELEALRAALRWAHRKGVIAQVPELELPGKSSPRERWLTRDEAEKLVASCVGHHIKLFVRLALHTGARRGAILSLTWDRVDLDNRLIDFRDPGKPMTRKRRVQVPINDTLYGALVEAKAGAMTSTVIEWAGGPVGSIKHGFRDAVTRAGLSGVTPHTLRHTAATWMAQSGVPLWEIAGMLGNTVEVVEDTYGHHAPDHLRRAAKALG